MKYNYNDLARTYVRGFYKFVVGYTNITNRVEAYVLFRYSLKKIYGMDPSEMNKAVLEYGDECVAYLKNLKGVPQKVDKISFEDRVHLFDYCETYLVSINMLFWKERRTSNENR